VTLDRISNSKLVLRLRNWWTWSGRPPVLFPIVWLIFYVPRIWRFGVYYGDWPDLMLINPFESIWWLFNSRPVALLVSYVLPRLIGDHPAIWQALLCASMLCASFLFYKILIRLGLLLERPAEEPITSYRISADVVVACWLLYPWTLGWTAWPTLMMGQLALLFFLLSMQLLLNAETKRQVVAAAFVYALCNLAYEPFYLAFLPFLAILFISGERRDFWLKVILLFAVQVMSVGYNRLMAHIMVNGGAAKAVNFSAFARLPGSVAHLFGELLSSAPYAPKIMIWTASAAATLTLGLILRSGSAVARRYAVILVVCFIAIAISVLQFAVAGYGVTGKGDSSRTTIAVSLWLALLVFVFVRACWTSTLPRVRGVSIAVIAALMICYGVGLYHQNELWEFAWRESIRTVMEAPAAEIAKLPANALIVYVGPSDIEAINYISRLQMWVALPTYHPETALPLEVMSIPDPAAVGEFLPLTVRLVRAPDKPVAIRPVVVRTSYQTLSWDGHELVLTLPKNWTESFRTSLVYEWDAYRGTLRRMEPNTPFGTTPK
jgi:hypothetical protein